MQLAEGMLDWEKDGIVLSSFDAGWEESRGKDLCLMAFAPCIREVSILDAIYRDIRSAVRANEEVTRAKTMTDTISLESVFNFY